MPTSPLRARDLIVEVRDKNLKRVGSIPVEDLRLRYQPVFNGVGGWSVQLPSEHRMVPLLRTPGAGILVTNIRTRKTELSGTASKPSLRATAQDVKGVVTVAGLTDDRLAFDALSFPDPSSADPAVQLFANDVRQGNAETLIREYVSYNIGPAAAAGRRPGYSLRSKLRLEAGNKGLGAILTKRPRFQNLAELINEIAIESGVNLGWRIVQVGMALELQVYQPSDRSKFIRLDVKNGTLEEQGVEFAPPEVTRMIPAGQDEGTQRQHLLVTTPESLQAEADWGLVIEEYKDQRQTDVVDELRASALGDLYERGFTKVAVKAVPANASTMVFMKDFFLGDRVAVVLDGQETKSFITEAAVVLDNTGIRTAVAIGDITDFDSASALRSQLQDNTNRISQLERNLEPSITDTWGVIDREYWNKPNTLWGRDGMGQPAMVKLKNGRKIGPLNWMTPYVPNGSRVVKLGWTGSQHVIIGQNPNVPEINAGEFPLALGGQWWRYDERYGESQWRQSKITCLPSGLVVLSGLVWKNGTPADGEVVATFDPALGPDRVLIHGVNNSDQPRSIGIYPDGTIRVRGSWASNGYASLDGISWWRQGVPQWTPIGAAGGSSPVRFASGFEYNPGWEIHGVPSYWKDPYGFLWFKGIVRLSANMSADNTPMILLPPELRGDLEQHMVTTGNEVFSFLGTQPGNGVNWKNGSVGNAGNWISLEGVCIPTSEAMSSNPWSGVPFMNNGWQRYPDAKFPEPKFLLREDGLCMSRGLTNGGPSFGTQAAKLPRELWSRDGRHILYAVSGASVGRIDLQGDWERGARPQGAVVYSSGPSAGAWVSLDSLKWVQ